MLQLFTTFRMLKSELKDDRGATLVEYAFLVAGMAVVAAAIAILFGTQITTWVTNIFA